MENIKEIRTIEGIIPIDEWISIENILDDIIINDIIQAIHCDTRDFFIMHTLNKPKAYKKANCGLEYESNKGLSKLYKVIKKQDKRYLIDKTEIIKWLKELCEITGGYNKVWRFIDCNLENCSNWNLKYIRFIKNDKSNNTFVVCNSYFYPIEYKKIVDNLIKNDY